MNALLLIGVLVAWAAAAPALSAVEGPARLPADSRLALPEGASVKWAYSIGDAKNGGLRFRVDDQGVPWFGDDKGQIRDLFGARRFAVEGGFRDFAWLENRRLVLLTENALGTLEPRDPGPSQKGGSLLLKFKPAMRLPYKGMTLWPGAGDSIYVLGRNPETKKREVYLVQFPSGKATTATKILTVPEEITAVAGDGQETYVAVGKLILRMEGTQGHAAAVPFASQEAIRGLVFLKGIGLFYATPSALGFLGQRPFEFMKVTNAEMRAGGGGLYLLIQGETIAMIAGVESFSKLQKAAAAAAALRPEVAMPKDARLVLPPGIVAGWVLAPQRGVQAAEPISGFGIDGEGRPWFGYRHKILANPLVQAAVEADKTYRDFAWIGTGQLFLCAQKALGVLEKPKNAKEPMVFKPLLALPYEDFRLLPDSKEGLYLIGKNPNGTRELFWMRLGARSEKDFKAEKLLEVKEDITAVAGDGDQTYVAIGKGVFKISGKGARVLFVHPSEVVRELAYSRGGGVFYATAREAGFLDDASGHMLKFLEATNPGLRVGRGDLFILLADSRSVMRLATSNADNR